MIIVPETARGRGAREDAHTKPWSSATVLGVTVVESVLYLAVVPAAIYGVIVLIAMWPKLSRARYSAGQDWDFAPVFWSANPQGVNTAVSADGEGEGVPDDARPVTARGGARGNW
jgi:hypothetical protein